MTKLMTGSYIEIDGKSISLDTLSKEKSGRINIQLQDAFLRTLEYEKAESSR